MRTQKTVTLPSGSLPTPRDLGWPRRGPTATTIGLLLLCASTIAAHELYLEPRSTATGGRLLLELRLGHGLEGEAVPRLPSSFRSLRVHRTDGRSEAVPGVWQVHPAGFVPSWRGEPLLFVYRSHPIPHRLGADRFERYLLEEGLDAVREVWADDRSAVGRERYVRCAASALGRSESGEASEPAGAHVRWLQLLEQLTALDSQCRLRLRIEPDPVSSSVSGAPGSGSVLLTFDGSPLAGALLRHSIVHRDGPEPRLRVVEGRTGPDGRVPLPTLPSSGSAQHRLHVVHAVPETDPEFAEDFEWRTFWTSLTWSQEAQAP